MSTYHIEFVNGESTRIEADVSKFSPDGSTAHFYLGDEQVLWLRCENTLFIKRLPE